MSLSAPSAASETASPAAAPTPVDTSPTPGAAAPTTGLRRGRPRWVRTFWPPLLVLVALVGLWYAAAYYYDQVQQLGYLVPYPHLVLQALFVDANSRATILTALMNSAMVALTGLVIAVVLGVGWAVLMSQAKWVERSLFPYAVILQCVPVLALVPLIGMLFGFDFSARVIVTVMIALFPMVANTLFGLQSADRAQRELFQLQGASRFTRLVKLQFPAALPSIFLGLRNSAGLSVIGAIVGDQFFQRGTPGIGVAIQIYASRLSGPELYAAILTAALFGVGVFLLFGLLTRLAVGRWYDLG
ncbi:MAG: ABC transporter permease subunit [Lapillicoccus sp.]